MQPGLLSRMTFDHPPAPPGTGLSFGPVPALSPWARGRGLFSQPFRSSVAAASAVGVRLGDGKNGFPKSHLADPPRHPRFERSSCLPSFDSDNVITSLRPEGMPWRWKNAFPKSHLADQPRHTRFERSSSCRHFDSDSVIASLRPEGTPWRWRNAFLKSYLLDSPIHTSFERSSAPLGQVALP